VKVNNSTNMDKTNSYRSP